MLFKIVDGCVGNMLSSKIGCVRIAGGIALLGFLVVLSLISFLDAKER